MVTGAGDARGYPGRGLHGAVVEHLGRRIVSGATVVGEALPREPVLADEYDVSRTVVREALRVLAAKGLVEARPMRGTRVRPRASWRLLDPDLLRWSLESEPPASLLRHLMEIRLMVEPASARLAAERTDEAHSSSLEQAWDDLARAGAAGDLEDFIEADLVLHRRILDATGNPLLVELVSAIETGLRLGRREQVRGADPEGHRLHAAMGMHREVVLAINAGDGAAAEAAMRQVVESAARDAGLGPSPSSPATNER